MKTMAVMAIGLILFGFGKANSYGLGEHELITKVALQEFLECVAPDQMDKYDEFVEVAVKGNIHEDTQYLRKSLQYHHFYHPDVYINAVFLGKVERCPSDYRLRHLEMTLDGVIGDYEVPRSNFPWDDQCKQINVSDTLIEAYDEARVTEHSHQFEEGVDEVSAQFLEEFQFSTEFKLRKHQEYLYELAHGIHHIQDMSSPPHTIPVMHPKIGDGAGFDGLKPKDGFEGYSRKKEVGEMLETQSRYYAQGLKCAFTNVEAENLVQILDEEASTTREKLSAPIPYAKYKVPNWSWDWVKFKRGNLEPFESGETTWYSFWSDENRDENGFGDYGEFEDNFGQELFELNGDSSDIYVKIGNSETGEGSAQRIYDDFTLGQYRQAVEATKRALHWGWKRTEEIRNRMKEE